MSVIIGKIEFESPINLEGSWGAKNLAPKAKSTMELSFNKDDTGFIEWICDELDIAEEIGLTFEFDANGRRTLVGYDGVMTLPGQAMDLLEECNVNCNDFRISMA